MSSEIYCLKLSGNEILSSELVLHLNQACDYMEASRGPALLIHIKGTPNPTEEAQWWPGRGHQVDIHLLTQWEQALRRVERLPSATVSATERQCGPFALEVLLSTDFRLASYDLNIRLQGPAGHVWPGMGLYRLANQVGAARSRRLSLFGANLSAIEAAQLGLIDEVVDQVMPRATTFVQSLPKGTCADVAVRRRLLLDAIGSTFENALGSHLAACDRLMRQIALPKNEGR
jgi:isomerase DpgB